MERNLQPSEKQKTLELNRSKGEKSPPYLSEVSEAFNLSEGSASSDPADGKDFEVVFTQGDANEHGGNWRSFSELCRRLETQLIILGDISTDLTEVLHERDLAGIEHNKFEYLLHQMNLGRSGSEHVAEEFVSLCEEKADRLEVEMAEMEKIEGRLSEVEETQKRSIEDLKLDLEISRQILVNRYKHPAGEIILHSSFFRLPRLRASHTAPVCSIEQQHIEDKTIARPSTEPSKRISPPRRVERNTHAFFKSHVSSNHRL